MDQFNPFEMPHLIATTLGIFGLVVFLAVIWVCRRF